MTWVFSPHYRPLCFPVQLFLNSGISFHPAAASRSAAWLVPATSPFHSWHCTQLFRRCPLPWGCFQRDWKARVADKGRMGELWGIWRCLFVSPDCSLSFSCCFICPDNRPKPYSAPCGAISAWPLQACQDGSSPGWC